MKKETLEKMSTFHFSNDAEELRLTGPYEKYEHLLTDMVSGEGPLGDENYLILWRRSEIEQMNDGYFAPKYLKDTILIGSDGGDTAYGRTLQGDFIEVPFLGMGPEEVKVIADSFDGFIDYLYNYHFDLGEEDLDE